MSRSGHEVWRLPLLRQLILLCCALLLVTGTAGASCSSCSPSKKTVNEEVALLSCSSSTISITYAPPTVEGLPAGAQAFDLECSYPNQTNTTMDLACGEPRFDHRRDYPQTITINVSAAGIPPGSQCIVKGCYADSLFVRFLSDICEIGRDCVWGEWSEWSECNSECGSGTQVRQRVKAVLAEGTGRECEGSFNESRNCTSVECTDAPTVPSEATPTEVTTKNISRVTTFAECNYTVQCPQHAECTHTSHGPSCSCVSGYHGDGSTCVVSTGIVVAVILTGLVIIMLILGTSLYFLTRRKRKGLDHKRLEKLMGTFDPNFTPHLSTNLRKFVATSEVSVFDTLWLHSPRPGENEYVTLDELGIHIHSNRHMRYTDSESSIEMRIAELADADEDEAHLSPAPRTANKKRVAQYANSYSSGDGDSRSNYSLDSHTVRRLFRLKDSFHNAHYKSDESSAEEETKSLDSEPKDFVEEVLRIDIGGFSDTEEEEEGAYMTIREDNDHRHDDETTTMEQRDFVEGALKIDIDSLEESDHTGERQYMNVEGVCFTLPESGSAELEPVPSPVQLRPHHSLSVLTPSVESINNLSDSSPLSTSTPTLFVS